MATILEQCIADIVGLSPDTCPCFEDGQPVDYNISLSGQYITNSEWSVPLAMPSTKEDCTGLHGWTLLERAREEGVRTFLSDFQTMVAKYFTPRSGFNGFLSENKSSRYITGTNKALMGTVWHPVKMRGLKMVIHSVRLWLTGADTYDVNVYYSDSLLQGDFTPAHTIQVTVNSGATWGETKLDTPIVIDLNIEGDDRREVYMMYDAKGAAVRHVRFDCGCGNARPWEQFMKGYGLQVDTAQELYEADAQTYHVNGLSAQVSLSCGYDWLCRDWDYDNDPYARILSDAVKLYSIGALVRHLLSDPNVNPLVYMNRDEIIQKGEVVHTMAQERLTYLAANIPVDKTDCFACKDAWRVSSAKV